MSILAAVLTTLLFALSAVSAQRSTQMLGGLTANFWRLVVATLLLAAWAHTFGIGLGGKSMPFFLLSGLVGFGLGDLALYQAIPRIGARLSVLLCQCLAAPFAALIEWLWLGTVLTLPQILWGLLVLAGVALALAPDHRLNLLPRTLTVGIGCGVLAAMGQGGGAVLSRKAYAVAGLAGQAIDGGTAAYERILAGLAVGALAFFLWKWAGLAGWGERPTAARPLRPQDRRVLWLWILANSLTGPTLGVSCYQWALERAPTGVVLPIVATTPLVIIPFVWLLDHERPTRQSLIGGVLAVIGTIGLGLS